MLRHDPPISAHKNGLLGSWFIGKIVLKLPFYIVFVLQSSEHCDHMLQPTFFAAAFFVVVSQHPANVDLFCEKSSTIRIYAFFTGQFKHSYQHGGCSG